MVDRLPIDAGRFHRDVRAARRRQPVAQLLKSARRGAESSDLLARAALGMKEASQHRLLMDIQSSATRKHPFHRPLLASPTRSERAARRARNGNLPFVLTAHTPVLCASEVTLTY